MDLMKVDEYLLRQLLQADAKITKEIMYLETSVLPLSYVVMSRRLNYLKQILNRNDHELINKFYVAQKRKPVKNDWVHAVEDDKRKIGMKLTDSQIKEMSDNQFKKIVKTKIRNYAFKNLINIAKKETHSKVSEIQYSDFKIQTYLTDPSFGTKERELLLKLRSRMFPAKANFRGMYVNNL